MPSKRLSVIVPALNEEANLRGAVTRIIKLAPQYYDDYEIIIFNDGSTDRTGEIAKQLAKSSKKIKVFHNWPNKGLGYCHWKGIDYAKFEYVIIIFGDNENALESIRRVISKAGKADIITSSYTNFETRPKIRRVISYVFTQLVNLNTGLSMKYYNGITLHRTYLVRQVPRRSTGFGYQAEVLTYLIKHGVTFQVEAITREERKGGVSSAFKIKNVINVIKTLSWLFWQFKIRPLFAQPSTVLIKDQRLTSKLEKSV